MSFALWPCRTTGSAPKLAYTAFYLIIHTGIDICAYTLSRLQLVTVCIVQFSETASG